MSLTHTLRGARGERAIRMAACAIVALGVAPCAAGAQDPAVVSATVTGFVYDSIARAPIPGATVEFVNDADRAGRIFRAVTSESGRYSLDSLPRGRYIAGFFHPPLDTLGIQAVPRVVDVNAAAMVVDLATPSARTLIAGLCQTGEPGDSSGLFIGHVLRTDRLLPLAGASVLVEWTELVLDSVAIRQERRHATARTTEAGWFGICGLPTDGALIVRAALASDSSGYVEVDVPPGGVRHLTLHVGGAALLPVSSADSVTTPDAPPAAPTMAWRGGARLHGTVRDSAGQPVVNATVLVWGTGLSTTSNDRGSFVLEGLPGGTHTAEVRVIGYVPVQTIVHLGESRPATADITLDRRAAILSTVTVRGQVAYSRRAVEFERRRRAGFGRFLTAQDLQASPHQRLTTLLRTLPGVHMDGSSGSAAFRMRGLATGSCSPSVYLDGMPGFGASDLENFRADEISAIEVYTRESERPFGYVDTNRCGAILVWTVERPSRRKKD